MSKRQKVSNHTCVEEKLILLTRKLFLRLPYLAPARPAFANNLVKLSRDLLALVVDAHFRPCDNALGNSCWQIFKKSHLDKWILNFKINIISEQFPSEYHVVCAVKAPPPSPQEKVYYIAEPLPDSVVDVFRRFPFNPSASRKY